MKSILLCAFLLRELLSAFSSSTIDPLVKNSLPSLVVNSNSTEAVLYKTANQFNSAVSLLRLSGAHYSIKHSFGLSMAVMSSQSTDLQTVTFSYRAKNVEIASFQIIRQSDGKITLNLPACPSLSIDLQSRIYLIRKCQPSDLQVFEIAAVYTILPVGSASNGAAITSNPESTVSFTSILMFQFDMIYYPSNSWNLDSISGVNTVMLTFSYSGKDSTYIGLSNSAYVLSSCPINCLQCDSTNTCTNCKNNFYLANKECLCGGTLLDNFFKDSSTTTLNNQAQIYYYHTDVCLPVNQFTQDITTNRQCEEDVLKLFANNQVKINADPTFSASAIDISFQITNPANSQYVSQTCLSKTYLVHSVRGQQEQTSDNKYLVLFLAVSKEGLLAFNSPLTVDFGNFDSCSKKVITNFTLSVTDCLLESTIILRDTNYNNTISSFTNRYITITSQSTQRKAFLPTFQNNIAANLTSTPYVTAVLCTDYDCYGQLSTGYVDKKQPIFIRAVILDPIYLYFKPQVFASLSINDENRPSLLSNFTRIQDRLVEYLSYQISFDSSELTSNMTISLKISYGVQVPAQYNATQQLNFTLTLDRSVGNLAGNEGFLYSLGFFVIIITAGVIVFSMAFGLIAYWISKCLKKEIYEETYASDMKRSNPRFQNLESPLNQMPVEMDNRVKLGNTKSTDISSQNTSEKNRILQSLM